MLPRRIAWVLLLSLSPFALDGCVSVGLSRSALEGTLTGTGTGTVEMSVFQKERDQDAREPVRYPVLSELFREEGSEEHLVARSMASAWSLPGLAPGTYRLAVSKRIDERGDVVPLASPVRKQLEVRPGEKASVDVVLEKVPVVWIVLAAITVVVLVVLSIDWIREGKIPLPPLPPPLPVPFPSIAVTGAYGPFPQGGPSASEEPAVADVYPLPGALVTQPRVNVSFLLSCPLARDGVERGAVLALGSRSGEIDGATSWLAAEQLLLFEPSRDFTAGETVTVTLDLEKLEGPGGRHGSGKMSTSFRVRRPGR